MKNSNCLELEVISESRRKRWKIKAKTRKSEDQSKSSYLKIPGISEKENRENRGEIYKKTARNILRTKGLTMRSGPFITLGTDNSETFWEQGPHCIA